MFTIVDFIKNIVESLEFTEYVDNITQTSTETQFDTCRTHQVTKGNYIVINGIKYKVKDFELNTWISVSGVVPLPFDSYTILAPNFFNGTPMMVSNVLADIRDWKKKLPMVYLLEVIREQRFNSRTNKLDRISDLRIFFLMSSNFEDWDISQHYDLAIEPMDNFLNDFIHALRYNAQVGEFDEYETINRANFGVYISKPSKRSGKYEDNITKLIDENVSGVELRINLPIQKNPCFSFPPDCPVPPTPIPPPPTFENLFSLNFDGVDDSLSFEEIIETGEFTISVWIKPTAFNTNTSSFIFGRASSNSDFLKLISISRIIIKIGGTNIYIDNDSADASRNLVLNQWQNLIITRNSSNEISFYRNSESWEDTPTQTTSSTLALDSIGRMISSSFGFNGSIDEFAIWSSDQTANIIKISTSPVEDLASLNPEIWLRNGDNGTWQQPQWLVPNNENKDKVSNYSMAFDGVDNYVGVTLTPSTLDVSVSFWIKASIQGLGNVFGGTGIFQYMSGLSGTPLLTNHYTVGWVTICTDVFDDQWHHIVVTFDNATSDLISYKDGILNTTVNIPGFSAVNHAVNRIGAYGTGAPQRYFEGIQDEISLFDSVLSQSEVTTIYNSGTPTTLPSGVVAHWKMGENSTFVGGVWTVVDEVGSNDGTSNGMLIDARIGSGSNSTSNSVSLNMDEVDRETDVPT